MSAGFASGMFLTAVVGLDPEGKVIVGTQAQNNLVMDPTNTVIEIKRLMGTYRREPNAACHRRPKCR